MSAGHPELIRRHSYLLCKATTEEEITVPRPIHILTVLLALGLVLPFIPRSLQAAPEALVTETGASPDADAYAQPNPPASEAEKDATPTEGVVEEPPEAASPSPIEKKGEEASAEAAAEVSPEASPKEAEKAAPEAPVYDADSLYLELQSHRASYLRQMRARFGLDADAAIPGDDAWRGKLDSDASPWRYHPRRNRQRCTPSYPGYMSGWGWQGYVPGRRWDSPTLPLGPEAQAVPRAPDDAAIEYKGPWPWELDKDTPEDEKPKGDTGIRVTPEQAPEDARPDKNA